MTYKPYETPDTVRKASLEYESTVISRHAFPQMEKSAYRTGGDWAASLARINSRGYRGRNFAVTKPKGTVRILFLGGSSTFDIWASEGNDWPHLVEKKLHEMGFLEIEVINAGTPGHASWDSFGRLYAEMWMFEPDYIVVYQGWNDITYFPFLSHEHSLLRHFRPYSSSRDKDWRTPNPFMYYTGTLDRLLCNSQLYVRLRYRYMVWRYKPMKILGARKLSMKNLKYFDTYNELGPQQYELTLRLIADLARNIRAEPIFLTQARLVTALNSETEGNRVGYHWLRLTHDALVKAFEDCDRAIFNAAEAENVPVLDLSQRFSGQSELFVDGVHTTTKGSEAIARAVAEFLEEMINAHREMY